MIRRNKQRDSRLGGLDLTPVEIATLDDYGTIIDVPAGTVLCRQGRTGRQLAWIIDGVAAVSRDERVIALVGQGDVVGEGTMVGAHDLCSADVVARTAMTVVVLSRGEWLSASGQAPSLVSRLFDVALGREPALAA